MLNEEPPNTEKLPKNVLLATQGRGPWYNLDGQVLDAFVIGVAGGSSSGKTTVAREILKRINVPWVVIVSQDSFYKELTAEESKLAFQNMHDFDAPDSFDNDLLEKCIVDLKSSRSVQIPIYNFSTHSRVSNAHQYLYGATVVIVEGIFVLHDPKIRNLLDLKVFVQCDSDLMLARRIRRDVKERGRDVSGILDQYLRYVKPSYDDHVVATSKNADIIVPGSSNTVAIDLITTHIRRQLQERSTRLRSDLGKCMLPIPENVDRTKTTTLPSNVEVMLDTPQIKGMHTVLRNADTEREEFVFFADRLATLICEYVFQTLDIVPSLSSSLTDICGVSISRSGECLEKGLRRVANDMPLGSILIQSDPESGEPFLYNVNLPECIKNPMSAPKAKVILMDSQIGTGATAMMAIRVLLDHRVQESNITVATFLISAQGGIHSICQAFPNIRIVSSAVDPWLKECVIQPGGGHGSPKHIWQICPGLGSFGDRYFGTEQ